MFWIWMSMGSLLLAGCPEMGGNDDDDDVAHDDDDTGDDDTGDDDTGDDDTGDDDTAPDPIEISGVVVRVINLPGSWTGIGTLCVFMDDAENGPHLHALQLDDTDLTDMANEAPFTFAFEPGELATGGAYSLWALYTEEPYDCANPVINNEELISTVPVPFPFAVEEDVDGLRIELDTNTGWT